MWKLPTLTPRLIRELADTMNNQGYACLEQAIPQEQITLLQNQVLNITHQHSKNYFAYHGKSAIGDNLISELAEDESFVQLLGQLYRLQTTQPPKSQSISPVLRCVQGQTGLKESNAFHYDASLVTALVPIFIPETGEYRGDLILFPNLRQVRSSVFINALEKAGLQNKLSRAIITWSIEKKWLKPTLLRIIPGNIYLFWGYRSLHANQPCDPAVRRATALFHYGDPHGDSLTTKWILKLNQRRARLASEQAQQN